MKIGIIIGSLGFGGAERVTATLSEYWVAQDHSVTIFTTMKKPEREYVLADGIQRIECYAGNKLSTIRSLRKEIKSNRQNIFLIMDTPMCMVAVPALLGLSIPFVVSERSAPTTIAIKKSTKLISHILMNCASGFVFQTNGARAYYNHKIQKRSVVIANPLKADKIPAPYNGERDKRVVAVGRLIPAKNYPNLFKAFKEVHLKIRDYKLEIYGDGNLHDSLIGLINDLEATDYIELMGASNTVLNDIRSAAVYVLSSDTEGMPNALIEAMALGMPCISTDCPSGGPRDLIENGINGLLVSVNNKEQLVEAMIRLLNDEQLSKNLAANAVKISEQLNITIIGLKWLQYFETITQRRSHNGVY